jgi:hypothetical protein
MTISIELDSVDNLPADSEALAEHVPAEQFATGVDLHDFLDNDHIQTLSRRVNLDFHPVVLAPDTTTIVVVPIQIQERKADFKMEADEDYESSRHKFLDTTCERAYKFESGLATPCQAPSRPPRPRHLWRDPRRVPQLRRLPRARFRVLWLRQARRAPPHPPWP